MACNIVERYCTSAVSMYQDVVKTYEYNLDVIKKAEQEQTDLEHEIELGNPKNARDGYKIYKELREVRLRRRKAKEENQLLQDIYDYFKSPQGQSFKNKIQQIQGDSAKLYEKQQNRTYTPRVRDDLTCTDKKVESYRPFEELLKSFNETKVSVQNGKLRK